MMFPQKSLNVRANIYRVKWLLDKDKVLPLKVSTIPSYCYPLSHQMMKKSTLKQTQNTPMVKFKKSAIRAAAISNWNHMKRIRKSHQLNGTELCLKSSNIKHTWTRTILSRIFFNTSKVLEAVQWLAGLIHNSQFLWNTLRTQFQTVTPQIPFSLPSEAV